MALVHGQGRNGHETALYRLWCGIKRRCYYPNDVSYPNYGGRGITLWVGWAADFRVFEQDILASIGPHPGPGWSIDRIDNNRGYEPGNVRWATASDQRRNQRPYTRKKVS